MQYKEYERAAMAAQPKKIQTVGSEFSLATAGAQRKVWSRRVDTEPLLASAYGRAASA